MSDYSIGDVKQAREQMIVLRDRALASGDMVWAITLTHTIAMLYELEQLKEAAEREKKEV
jgi:hypothetical protein